MEDPRDDCDPFDPSTPGRKCSGICVTKPEDDVARTCDTRGGELCAEVETCAHDLNAGCGAAEDCPGVCMVLPTV